jgi:fructose-1,6-bisphosphatase/sedoheptulose 1,7-bisphosphatase-like protein
MQFSTLLVVVIETDRPLEIISEMRKRKIRILNIDIKTVMRSMASCTPVF